MACRRGSAIAPSKSSLASDTLCVTVCFGGLAGGATSGMSHNEASAEAPAEAPTALGGAVFAAAGGGGAAAVPAKDLKPAPVAEVGLAANGSNVWSYAMSVAGLAEASRLNEANGS